MTADIVKLSIEQNRHKYPHLTEQQLVDICETPFRYMKEVFRSGDMSEYRLKYLGTFKARPSNLYSQLKKLDTQLEMQKITQEQYDEKAIPIKNKIEYYEKFPY